MFVVLQGLEEMVVFELLAEQVGRVLLVEREELAGKALLEDLLDINLMVAQ